MKIFLNVMEELASVKKECVLKGMLGFEILKNLSFLKEFFKFFKYVPY